MAPFVPEEYENGEEIMNAIQMRSRDEAGEDFLLSDEMFDVLIGEFERELDEKLQEERGEVDLHCMAQKPGDAQIVLSGDAAAIHDENSGMSLVHRGKGLDEDAAVQETIVFGKPEKALVRISSAEIPQGSEIESEELSSSEAELDVTTSTEDFNEEDAIFDEVERKVISITKLARLDSSTSRSARFYEMVQNYGARDDIGRMIMCGCDGFEFILEIILRTAKGFGKPSDRHIGYPNERKLIREFLEDRGRCIWRLLRDLDVNILDAEDDIRHRVGSSI